MPAPTLSPLHYLAPLLVAGADAKTFLQGQLSNDIGRLDAGVGVLASCNSPQGRVQAVLTLVARADDILLLLPASMAPGMLARLRKYVLRSKVTLAIPGDITLATGNREALGAAGLPCPDHPGQYLEQGNVGILRWMETGPGQEARYLLLNAVPESGRAIADAAWRLADIRTGLPQVLPETHESFVAQMLNLDLLGGISFEKGCYTGQEIIARTHYRGAIKRRMLRFAAACPPPPPGTRILDGQAPAGEVVDAVATPAGCELLAVVSLAQKDAALTFASPAGVSLAGLPLPYALEGT